MFTQAAAAARRIDDSSWAEQCLVSEPADGAPSETTQQLSRLAQLGRETRTKRNLRVTFEIDQDEAVTPKTCGPM